MNFFFFIASMCSLFFLAGCASIVSAPVKTVPTTSTSTTTTTSWYTMQDVKQHNTSSNCRTIVEGKIYDMSSFASLHSGWPDSILSVCGKDGTSIFARQHGTQIALLQKYFLSNLQ